MEIHEVRAYACPSLYPRGGESTTGPNLERDGPDEGQQTQLNRFPGAE